jgi:hypothetical protein
MQTLTMILLKKYLDGRKSLKLARKSLALCSRQWPKVYAIVAPFTLCCSGQLLHSIQFPFNIKGCSCVYYVDRSLCIYSVAIYLIGYMSLKTF